MFKNLTDFQVMLDEGQAGGGAAGGGNGQQNQDGQQGEALVYDTWIAAQPENVRGLLEGHTKGLKDALNSERDRNKTLEKSLRDAASKAEKGSEAEKQLTELANQVQNAMQQTAFYESAVLAGVNDLKLAWLAAKDSDLFKRDGSVDFEALKKSHPSLFGAQTRSNNGGSGTNGQLPKGESMNAFIRKAAGK